MKIIKLGLIYSLLFFLISCNNSDIITRSEKEWLKQHPNLVVGLSPNAPPYQFVNEKGKISGIFIDFFSIIEKRIDYKFKKVYESDFAKLLNDTKEGNVDVILEVQQTDEREKYLNFTSFLLSHNHVIITSVSQQEIISINDLKDKKIAVTNLYAVQEYLSKKYPEYKLIPFSDDIACLRAVSTGQADAFVCQQAVATYYIEKEGISNLNIAGEINYTNELAIASRKSLDTLNTILTKAVNSISKNEKRKIYKNWLSYTVKPFYLQTDFLLIVSIVVLSILLFAFLFNFVLQKRVKQKTIELIKAKEEAEENETFLTNIFENIPSMVFVKNADDFRYIRFNKAGEKLLGYRSEELIGKNDYDFFPKEEADFFTSKDREVFKTNEPIIIEEENINTKFGIKKLYTKKIALKDKKGNHKYLLGISEDITKKIEIQRELKKAKEQAEESDRLKSAFLANMSHEIRTPMNGILGFSDLLKKPNLSGDQQQKYIGIIEKSGERMLNIINDIVHISKIEAGLMNVDIKESNINEQIEYIYTFFKPEVEAKGMQLFFKNTLLAKEATIKTDREKLFAILTNLVKNAIKYSEKGTIEFGYVLKSISESTNHSRKAELEFFVKDTGIGIPKDRQKAIFERFIQADIPDTMARQGAGLGLSITKAYVEILDGKIWVESEEGIGSTFYFTLPYNPEFKKKINTKDVEVTDSSENIIKNLKILIAEDDDISEMLISINVCEFSNEILRATTGREAIETCRNNPDIDLILMDIRMPEMDGYEATCQIRKFNKDVIIIAQTAYGLTGDKEKSLDAGCNDYITKPIKKEELESLIQKYFEK
ncbi:transporter substrate-binding domain-containing protein [uncultured Lutibacter sp.]|uniref:ATP-binding protein n=1 Tax=uncultured Lutibacter sp. TaxID=437739 RepID=UPI00262635B9|nr:transporter substrate-binding domain-containing protein [uncultured Lutibacter sp.]